jgi:hypothetical protein
MRDTARRCLRPLAGGTPLTASAAQPAQETDLKATLPLRANRADQAGLGPGHSPFGAEEPHPTGLHPVPSRNHGGHAEAVRYEVQGASADVPPR